MERLKDDGKKSERDAVRDGEPVEVIAGGSMGEEMGSRVLDLLEPGKESGG